MQARQPDLVRPQLALRLDEYEGSGASITCTENSTTFTCTIAPVSDATFEALGAVAAKRGRIFLYSCGVPMPFDLTAVERKDPRKVRVVGLIVGSTPAEAPPGLTR